MKRESEKWETKSDKGTERQETELGGRGEEGRVKDRELKKSRWESWALHTTSRCLTLEQTGKGIQIFISSVKQNTKEAFGLREDSL